MEDNKPNYRFFVYLSIFWITIGWGAYLLALIGFFYWWTISIFIAAIITFGSRFILSSLQKISRNFLFFNLFFIFFSITFVYFSAPTIFSGRDQASISQAAIHLSQSGRLPFSNLVSKDFFSLNNLQKNKTKNCLIDNLNDFNDTSFLKLEFYQLYCQALNSTKAFNFPGFYYTNEGNLVTQFPLVYISYLALFYSFLGLSGFAVANGLLLYFFFLTFYFIINVLFVKSSQKINLQIQIITTFLLVSSFCFMWFSKFTLTENMTTPLLWIGILTTLILTQEPLKNLKHYGFEFLLFFLSFGLLIFTRIEGLAFFVVALLVLFFHKNSKKYFKQNFIKIIFPILLLLTVIFILNVFIDIYFYKSILKATLGNIQESANELGGGNNLSAILSLFKIFGIYGILAPLLFGTLGIAYLIKNKNYQYLIPFIIISPSLFYLLSPQITPEHPWMLRRFIFSILPGFILYSIILISSLHKKKNIKIGALIFAVIFLLNLNTSLRYLTFIPGKNLLQETRTLGKNFSTRDLILVDQLASGDKFEMIADPLNSIFGRNAVYFFNPQDLAKIDTKKYNRIYLITPNSRVDYYKKTVLEKDMFFIKNYSLNSSTLISDSPYSLPKKGTQITAGSIFEILK